MFKILPYRQGSKSALALAAALSTRVLRKEGSRYSPREGDRLINWGVTTPLDECAPRWTGIPVLNLPAAVREVSNKLAFFSLIPPASRNSVPDHWTLATAIPDDAYPVVCRTVLAGHSGAGIVIANSADELVDAPLYVKYQKKTAEYRIHVGRNGDELIEISRQRKARRHSVPDGEVNWQVRNLAGGFVYIREDAPPPARVLEVASEIFSRTSLDFGAVDVIYHGPSNRAYVLEINTAPGLEGQTVDDYAAYFSIL